MTFETLADQLSGAVGASGSCGSGSCGCGSSSVSSASSTAY